MKKYVKSKLILIIVFSLVLLFQHCVLFLGLGFGFFPQYWYLDFFAILFLSLLLYLLPMPMQKFLSFLVLTGNSLLCIINLTLYESAGRIFDWEMLSLLFEAAHAFGMAVFPVVSISFVIISFFVYIAFVAVFSINKQKHYKEFINRTSSLVVSVLMCVTLVLQAFLPNKILNNYKNNLYFVSDSYEYASFQSSYVSLKKFGLFGFYVPSLIRTLFPKTTPRFKEDVAKYDYKYYNSSLTGVLKENNVLMILAESFEDYAISKDLTPTIYALKNGIDLSSCGINNFYNKKEDNYGESKLLRKDYDYSNGIKFNGTNIFEGLEEGVCGLDLTNFTSNEVTSVSEARLLTGNFESWEYSIPKMLNASGYKTQYLHGNLGTFYKRNTYIEQEVGFNAAVFGEDMSEWLQTTGNLDCYCLDSNIVNHYLANEDEFDLSPDEKFMTFFMTITTHGNYLDCNLLNEHYSFFDAVCATTNEGVIGVYNRLEDENLKQVVRNYLSRALDTEKAVAQLIDDLYNESKLDKTTIVFVSDHNAYADNIIEFKHLYYKDLLNKPIFGVADRYIIPCFFYSTKLNGASISNYKNLRVVSHLTSAYDIAPTLLTILGVDFEQSVYMGTAIINESQTGGNLIYNSVTYSSTNGMFIGENYITYDGYVIESVENITNEKRRQICEFVNEYRKKTYFNKYVLTG